MHVVSLAFPALLPITLLLSLLTAPLTQAKPPLSPLVTLLLPLLVGIAFAYLAILLRGCRYTTIHLSARAQTSSFWQRNSDTIVVGLITSALGFLLLVIGTPGTGKHRHRQHRRSQRNRMLPESGKSRPAIIRKSVVLPEPDGPSKATSSPSSISSETFSRAR
jgi:hypothetical protein